MASLLPKHSWRKRGFIALLVFAALLSTFVLVIQFVGAAPRVLGPYLERRALGHAAWIETTARMLSRTLVWIDRGELAPRQAYPQWVLPPHRSTPPSKTPGRRLTLSSAAQLSLALVDAQAGDVLTLAPGVYRFSGNALAVHRPGLPDFPITLRAAQPGSVTLEFDLREGFHVTAPHWVFENLTLVGVCRQHSECAHAFHVVGAAKNVVIRNNVVRDFDAHIKINGSGGQFPDRGHIRNNQLYNTSARTTDAPVTPIDLVAASGWLIEDNLIADFVKTQGDRISYGAFAKGGGSDNVFSRNLVLCEQRLRGAPGQRVGLSLGGGGSDPMACRDGRCAVEQERGVLSDNLVISCSDDGIYINRAAQSRLLNNTVIDTAGINVRFGESAAEVTGNQVNAPIVARDGATMGASGNDSSTLLSMYFGLARLGASRCTAQHAPWANEVCEPGRSAAPSPY